MSLPVRSLLISLTAISLSLVLHGCTGGSSSEDVLTPEAPMQADAQELAFAFRTRGTDGAIPTTLAFHANLPIFSASSVGKFPPEGTEIVLDPPVPGTLTVEDRASVVFTPSEPLRPATTYKVRLVRIGGSDSLAWMKDWKERNAEFTTPEFALLRAAVTRWDVKKNTATIAMAFSGTVNAEEVAQHVELRSSKGVLHPTAEPGDTENVVNLIVSGSELSQSEGDDLDLTLSAGVTLTSDTTGNTLTAPATQLQIVLTAPGPVVTLPAVKIREGMNGYYVDVFCDDEAVTEKRWFWDRESWDEYRLSTRCALDEASIQQQLHVSVEGKDTPISVSASDTGFRVFGAFPFGQITLRIDAGARTVDGGVFNTAIEKTIDVPHRARRIDFASQGRYLPHSAWTSLAVQHTNLPAVRLTVRHVPEENVMFWMSGAESTDARTANVVLSKDIALSAPIDERTTSWIDVASLLPDARSGVYEISLHQVDPAPEDPQVVGEAENDEDYEETFLQWHPPNYTPKAQAVSRILLTDMHLVAKVNSADATHGWATSVDVWTIDVHTNEAVAGANVSLVRPSGQVVGKCSTGSDGHCLVTLPADGVDPTEPMALIARNEKDFTYLKFSDLKLQVPQDTAGDTGVEAPYRAALWTERGVYRPGDIAHLAVLVRGTDHLAPSPALPMALHLYDPTGKELRKQVVDANEAGLATWDISFGDWATTGSYRVTAEIGGKVAGTARFNVEEFVPERLRVNVKSANDNALTTDIAKVDVQGDWLFGGAAAGSRVELSCQIAPGSFTAKGMTDYHFGPTVVDGESAPQPITLGTAEASLDDAGHAQLSCPTSASVSGLVGPGTLVARAAVFEGDSGRTTVSEAKVAVHPERAYVGLRGPQKVQVGRPMTVDGVVVDWNGKPVAGTSKVDLTLFRLEEEVGWIWDYESNESVYRRTPRRVKEAKLAVVATDGVFHAELTPNEDAAGWIVLAKLGKSTTELKLDSGNRRWWWANWDATVDQTPRAQMPTPLVLDVPESAVVDADVTVSAKAPYAGRVLWTVEADSVIHSEWVKVTAGPISWNFAVDTFRPNVYVSALLVKDPHLESQTAFMPDRAFGVANLRILPEQFTLPLRLTVPKEVRPQTQLTVQVDTGPLKEPGFVTVAAVDDGILSLTKFADPDPALAIFARRALGVTSYETVGWTLLSQPGGAGRRTGGDASGSSVRVQMVRPVALWSGVIAVPTSGKVTVTLPVPSYRGSLHIMGVATTRSRMGHASADVVVRDPLTLMATLPRFLTVGDVAQVPVQITNLTGSAQDVQVQMNVTEASSQEDLAYVDVSGRSPAIALGGAQTGRLKLAANASGTLVFQLSGRSGPGAARVDIKATAGKEVSTDHFDVPVQLAEPESTETVRIPLGSATASLQSALAGWKPGTEQTQVWVTANPYAEAFAHLRHLIHYPYGCIEQTSSSARPLLYARELISKAAPSSVRGKQIEAMVQAGLDRVLGMQTPSGGFSYWPGGEEAVVWGSAYAVHFLLDAQQAGYSVPKADLDDAVRWLGKQLDRSHNSDDDRAYVHYVLARAGKPQMAAAQRLLDRLVPSATRDETIYELQAAIWLAGDHRYENALKHPNSSLNSRRANDWTFWSGLRERGFQLAIFRDLFGADSAGQPLADAVAAGLTGKGDSGSYTTQELAWGLTGLAKSMSNTAEDISATLTAGGVVQTPTAPNSGIYLLARPSLLSTGVSIKGKPGQFAVVTTRGNRVSGPKLWGGDGLTLTRKWKNAAGEEVNPAALALGTLVYVDITVQNTTRAELQNIALTDRIPASWEIENPRLGRGALPDWADPDSLWSTDNLNVRDDRVELFGTLPASEAVHVIYAVRTTFAGTFRMPDVSAEAMYNPTIWARSPGGAVIVEAPWAGNVL